MLNLDNRMPFELALAFRAPLCYATPLGGRVHPWSLQGDYDPREIILELLPAVMAIIDAGGIQFADVEVRDITLGLMAVTADLVFDGELVKYIEIDYPSIN